MAESFAERLDRINSQVKGVSIKVISDRLEAQITFLGTYQPLAMLDTLAG